MIGGNKIATMQVRGPSTKNEIGEKVRDWLDCISLNGFLDLCSGDSKLNVFDAKIQESTHIFLCDFTQFKNVQTGWLWDPFSLSFGVIQEETGMKVDLYSDNTRLIVDGKIYNIQLIDDPMGMHEHLEIYLKFVGGQ